MSLAGIEKIIPPGYFKEFKTTRERLEEWDWLQRFLEQNPDVEKRWQQHKTYEILKKDE